MLVTLPNNRLLSVIWRYEEATSKKKGFEGIPVEKTTCIVKDGIGPEASRIAEASSVRSPLDRPCKNCGRRVSLDRVIKQLNIPREQRHLFWNAYFEMRNGRW
jgi:hypothetical protein